MLGEKNVSHLRRFGFLVGNATQCSRTGLVYAAPPALERRYRETSGSLLDEEPTLCKKHPSAELRAGPSAPVKHTGRKKRAGLRAGPSIDLRAGKGAAPA